MNRPLPSSPRRPPRGLASGLLAACLLAGCGGGSDLGGSATVDESGARGSLVHNPPLRVTALTAAQFADRLAETAAGRQVLALAGTPRCGVDFHYIEYGTVGGTGEATRATGALMVPTGDAAACAGPRPVLLYGHGTSTERAYDIADITDTARPGASEGVLVAALYAAQGFIVVAPNYAGYDRSPLPYHPYLNATQQAGDLLDALTASRTALARLGGAADSGKVLLTGYSQGGFAALAAHRALQAAGQPVVASAPLSAPSAISLLVDRASLGAPALGATAFTPLLTTSWQRQSGSVYAAPGELYEPAYAAGIESLLPAGQPLAALVVAGRLPQLALWPADARPGPASPAFAPFYGSGNLLRQAFLDATAADIAAHPCPGNAFPPTPASLASAEPLACSPANGFRRAAVANDLRTFVPARPVFFCGGAADPTVPFASTQATAGYFAARGMPQAALTVLDLEAPAPAGDPFAAARTGFAQAKAALGASGGSAGVASAYHASLVAPWCMAAARGFFQRVLASGG